MSFRKPAALFLACSLALWGQAPAAHSEWKTQQPVYLQPASFDVRHLLAAPPVPGTLEAEADLEAVRMAESFRTPEQVAWARFIGDDSFFKHAPEIGPWFEARNLPVCDVFFKRVLGDSRAVSGLTKKLFDRPRPPKMDPGLKPCVEVPGSSSYPSSHSTQAFVMAGVLGDLFPEKRERLLERAHRAAWSRIIGGVHFPTDDVGGRILARAILVELRKSPVYQADLEVCRKEIAAYIKAN